ncbi:MAG: hypothetical protein H0X17_01750 [Deltaproteobacteria bacterium]|nr:hypothetical protein [Deltaproteobacteria bacterium]
MAQPDGPSHRGLLVAATSCAAVVLASQLAGKAARDAIFLEQFAVTNLPLLLAVSSALAIGITFFFARQLTRGIPVRVVRIANAISAVLLVAEWALIDYFPRPVATVVYMHQTLLGPILVSGFWSVMSECFDPRTARRVLGTIGTGATVGAVAGAVLAERIAALAGTHTLLLAIAALQLIASWRLAAVAGIAPTTTATEPAPHEAAENITQLSLLRRLAVITVITTVAAAFLDYLFKVVATESVKTPDDLTRLFAMFHGIVGILTAVLQWLLGKWALQTFGLARTLATLPGAVIVFGLVAVFAPGIGTFVALRGAENVLRNSLYREAYEVFYTPLLASERRATKTIIDVGVERFGDVLGGIAVLAILSWVSGSTMVLLVGAIVLSAAGMVVALKAQQSYVEALERSLMAHSIDPDKELPRDRTTQSTLEMVALRAGTSSGQLEIARPSRWPFRGRRPRGEPQRGALDPTLRRLAELTSGESWRIQQALQESLLSPAGVAHSIPLLGREDVAEMARQALRAVAPACLGQLADAVRDPQLSVTVRSRLPMLIAEAVTHQPRTEDGRIRAELARLALTVSLADPEFEVRFHVAEALALLHEHHPDLEFDLAAVFDGVRRELAVDASVRRALDSANAEANQAARGDGPSVVARTTSHLGTLLALALPAEPIRTAFHSLHSEDPSLRGVALEYLENVLPVDIRDRMWLLLALETPVAVEKRPIETVLDELLRRPGSRTAELAAQDPAASS